MGLSMPLPFVYVYAQGPEDSMSRSLARYVQKAAAEYVPSHTVRPMAREDRFSRSSDHTSFTQRGFPAVVFRESKENFSRGHGDDTPEGVDFAYWLRTLASTSPPRSWRWRQLRRASSTRKGSR